jgi:exopolysaccharide biosynthesis polyprenyl glycosylphosphotransferase
MFDMQEGVYTAPRTRTVSRDGSHSIDWSSSFQGLWRRHALLQWLLGLGAMGAAALSVIIAHLMVYSWPPSMGTVSKEPVAYALAVFRAALAPEFRPYLALLFAAPLLYGAIYQWLGIFRPPSRQIVPFGEAWNIFKGAILGAALLAPIITALQSVQEREFPWIMLVYIAACVFAGVLLWRAGLLIVVLCAHALDIGLTRAAVIRRPGDPMDHLAEVMTSPGSDYHFRGFINLRDGDTGSGPDDRWLGGLHDLGTIINEHDLNEIVLAQDPSELSTDQRYYLAETCWSMGVDLKMVTPFHPFFHTSAAPEPLGDLSLLKVERVGLYATWPQMLKRLLDLLVAFFALLAISPILLVTMILIKLDSRGPIFFVQKRVGLNGRTFRMFKFRSMTHGADSSIHQNYLREYIKTGKANAVDENGQPVFKIASDPRVTRLGRFIRKTSIDELPQLFNVLKGDMSLVGPRPAIQYEVDEYEDWHRGRLNIRPGITGLWQVSGRNRLSFDDMVRLDITYIEEWSVWLDLRILLRTVPVVLHWDKAY